MALVDSNYRCLYVDVGCNGRVSDGGVFRGSTLQESLEQRTANIPQPTPLPGTDMTMPFFVVADEAFPLKSYLMKPLPGEGFPENRESSTTGLSRARRIVENTFGIFANRFSFFLTTINLDPDAVEVIVLASCALHNYYVMNVAMLICGEWLIRMVKKPETGPSPATGSIAKVHKCTLRGQTNRERLMRYFNSEAGAVPWQWDRI